MLEELMENAAFCNGIAAGIGNKVVLAHSRGESIKIGETLYYLQTGRERLQEMMDKVCR